MWHRDWLKPAREVHESRVPSVIDTDIHSDGHFSQFRSFFEQDKDHCFLTNTDGSVRMLTDGEVAEYDTFLSGMEDEKTRADVFTVEDFRHKNKIRRKTKY